jgi:Do/DeqQ family serine protease
MKKLSVSLAPVALALSISFSFASMPSLAALPNVVGHQQMPSLAPIVELVTPAVVSISVAGTKVSQQQVPEVFEFFFGPQQRQRGTTEQPFRGLGSGVILNAEKGYVVTNFHVVNDADEIKVSLKDGREFDAKVLGTDRQSDIALLQIKADNLSQISMSDSDELRVGDFTLAVGNPFGLGQTVTSGIVSALGRSGLNIENLENFIQTDAAINSGNSGGALINLKGELIGINTAIIAPGGGNVGIGFAIPSNMVSNLVDQFIEYGEVRRGVLGVVGGELTSELAKAFGSESQHGAFVNQVMPESAAAEAGIEAGDIIVAVNGKPVASFAELRARIGTLGAGKMVTLEVIRDTKHRKFKVTLKRAEETNVKAKVIHPALEGATLSSTDKDADLQGVKVSSVDERSRAYNNGLQVDDVIIGVNKVRVKNLAELRKLLEKEPRVIALNIVRGNSNLYLVIQ